MDYAFYELNLNKVYAYVWENNSAMMNLNKKAGFKIEGLLRDDILSMENCEIDILWVF